MMSNEEAAWVAGLLEGEGCFDFTDTNARYPRVRIEMADKDVILRLQAIAGGCYRIQQPRKDEWSTMHHLGIQRRADLVPLLQAVRPWMGQRRKKRIDELLACVTKMC